jgi:hypothetical protein
MRVYERERKSECVNSEYMSKISSVICFEDGTAHARSLWLLGP